MALHGSISGGVDITNGWTLHNSGKNIYKRTGVNWNFRQLYINNERGIRAHTPNLTNSITQEPYYRAKNNTTPFQVNAAEIGSWANNEVAEMVLITNWKHHLACI